MSGSGIFFDKKDFSSQTFTSPGTFNVPDGVHQVFVEMYGGGGGGAKCTNTSSPAQAFGGEAGQFVFAPIDVTPGGSVSVTIGSGGTGSVTAGVEGADGTNTSFGSRSAAGGAGGGTQDLASTPSLGSGIALRGFGVGRNSFRSSGGSTSNSAYGGDAGYGAGGNGNTGSNGTNGGLGAGGGGNSGIGQAGNGGDGICIVYWKQP